jgi:cytochrome c biogenesis protein CcmG, thiol:disulfide interchange protein DsbE
MGGPAAKRKRAPLRGVIRLVQRFWHTHLERLRLPLLVCLAAAPGLTATAVRLDSLSVGSHTYCNVTIIGANKTDIYFTHDGGIANAKLRQVDAELQKRFDYDPEAAAEAERQKAEDDAEFLQAQAQKITARIVEANRVATNAIRSPEHSLADPVSDKSLLGRPAPPLEIEKWLTEKPELNGKFVLVSFWAPWSTPCRRAIPDLNALQKKFADRLVIIGLSSEPERDIENMPATKIDFPLAIDSKSQLSTAAGVSSVPYVLLMDPEQTVLYQGHPGALDEKMLQTVLVVPED